MGSRWPACTLGSVRFIWSGTKKLWTGGRALSPLKGVPRDGLVCSDVFLVRTFQHLQRLFH
jgi:hypothetical protein